MNNPVLHSLLPVVLLVAIGFIAGRAGWIRATAIKDLSNLVFMVLTPALLALAVTFSNTVMIGIPLVERA